MQDPRPVPQVVKKKKKKTWQTKAAGVGLEGFVDWTNLGVSESAEEEKNEMSGLFFSFTARMRKRATST